MSAANQLLVVAYTEREGKRRDAICHIHFEGSSFWFNVGKGTFREFFKRVGPSKALQPTIGSEFQPQGETGRRGTEIDRGASE
jgi:hypothetical protein